MKKTAVVYDKWLHSLGGGEVVACNIAKILKEEGYDVTFICGKKVPLRKIYQYLKIDLQNIKFIEVWNDEVKLKEVVKGKDLFVNCSFMDYSFGYARRNIYYTHFPTEVYVSVKGMIFNKLVLPLFSKIIKPVEFINGPEAKELKFGHLMYLLGRKTRIGFSYLDDKTSYLLKFTIFFENFYKKLIENFAYEVENAKIKDKDVKVDHYHNVIRFALKIKPLSQTVYLNLLIKKNQVHLNTEDKIYLLTPKILSLKIPDFVYKLMFERINTRLRAGVFMNILERLKTYQVILANSEYTKKWIKNYWKRDGVVLSPPVETLFDKYDLTKIKKKNWICNVGRFFTLGHGKKQEVLIEAFKKLYKQGYKKWHLHLVGGLGDEPSSQEFAKYLKKQAKGYPVYFHFNASRKKVEGILLKSKIYWHATGYGENENKRPIKFEHFGIAPIEGISAGCIPILYNGGGLKEIVDSLKIGDYALFTSEKELVENTKKVIQKKKSGYEVEMLLQTIKRKYSREAFKRKFIKEIQGLV